VGIALPYSKSRYVLMRQVDTSFLAMVMAPSSAFSVIDVADSLVG
jgi:hypothetical protein